MRTLILTGLLFLAPNAAFANECSQLKQFINSLTLPLRTDDITTLLKVNVNCEHKTVEYIKQVSVLISAFKPGAGARKQEQHTNMHCNSVGLGRRGWTVNDFVYDVNGDLMWTLITTPGMCK